MKLKKLVIPVIAALVIGIMAVSCTGKAKQKPMHSGVEYYRNLLFSETPYDIEKGTYPITPEEAKNVNSYKFTYDDAGRLLSVEYCRDTVLLGYSSMGGAAKITYDYKDNMQVKHFFDKNNQPIESGGVFAAEYMLDADGNRASLMYLGKDGSMIENRNNIHSYSWSMLPDGKLRELRYNLNGEETVMNPFCPFYELRFTYNSMGYPVKMENYRADTLYNCTAENCGDIGVSYFKFTPDQSGDIDTFAVYNVIGQMSNLYWGWSKRVTRYNEFGYPVETTYFDQDNEYVGGKLVPVTKYSYDDHGALTETRSFDKDGNLINNPSNGIAVTEYKYDSMGHRTETINYDKDHEIVKPEPRT
jgi:hypothetical protein